MQNVPKWKQRIAGKSLPMEKFAIRKSERFLKQGNFLVLPALELIYVWNGFRILGQSYNMIEPVYLLVEKAEAKANAEKSKIFMTILSHSGPENLKKSRPKNW